MNELFDSSLALVPSGQVIEELLEINEKSSYYNLTLTKTDAYRLIYGRNSILADSDRLEFGFETLCSIIEAFCKSPYINQDDYVEILSELQYIFYALKNETEDKISDADLIRLMEEMFDGECGGSLELLKGNGAEYILSLSGRKLKKPLKTPDIIYAAADGSELVAYRSEEAKDILKHSMTSLVAELSYRYNKGKSFSIRSEDAEMIARSSLYIADISGELDTYGAERLRDAYYKGLEVIDKLMREAWLLYEEVKKTRLEIDLNEYNNSIDRVSSFFNNYDRKYAAAEIPVELSYFPAVQECRPEGVSYIIGWMTGILCENVICGLFEKEVVEQLLEAYQEKAENEQGLAFVVVNVFELVFVNGIFSILAGKQPSDIILTEKDRRLIESGFEFSEIDISVNYFLNFFNISDERLTGYIKKYVSKKLKPKLKKTQNAWMTAVYSKLEHDII